MFAVHFGMTAAEVEALLIRHTLEKLDGHRAEAARVLGLSRRTLHYRLSSAATPQ
jgi:two-component system response regulator HydG